MAQKWFSTHNDETHLIFYKKKTPKLSYNHRRRNRRNTAKFLMNNFFWDTLYQTQPTKPNLPNPIYQTQPTKPDLPNQTYQTKPTEPNLPNHAYQTKPTVPSLSIQI